MSRRIGTFVLLSCLLLTSHLIVLVAHGQDSCALSGASCSSCVGTSGCGWCSWKGTCVSGGRDGPSASVCYEPSPTSKNWYFGTCTDECYLVCGVTCSSSQSCVINRNVEGPPQCSCPTKTGIIIGAVVGGISCFCLTLTIFVCIRRRNAMRHAKELNARLGLNSGLTQQVRLPGGQPAAAIRYAPMGPAYQPPTPHTQAQ